MSDAPISSTSPAPVPRGQQHPPGSTAAQFNGQGGIDVLLDPGRGVRVKRRRPLTGNEIRGIADRLSHHSSQPEGDLALFYLLLTTGAKPLELSRLRITDVIAPSGAIRSEFSLSPGSSINGVARRLFIKSEVTVEAIVAYVRYRVANGHGVGTTTGFAGLDPQSPRANSS